MNARFRPRNEHDGRPAGGSAPVMRLRAEEWHAEVGRPDTIAGAVGLHGGTAGQHDACSNREKREAGRTSE